MDLQVYGMRNVMEQATTHIAVDAMSGGKAKVHHGNVAHLVGADASMNSASVVNTAEARAISHEAALPLADVATNYDTQFLRFSAQRPDMRILFTVTRGLYHIVARRSAGIAKVEDLHGKRIATFPRTSSHYYLAKELQAHGLRESDIELVGLAPIFEISKAIIEKRAEAICIWEPASQAAVDALGSDAIELKTPGVFASYFNLNTTAAKLADPAKRKEMVELTRHLIAASKLVKEKPQVGCDWLAQAGGWERGLIERAFRYHDYNATIIPDQLDVMADQEHWIAQEQGRAPRSREALATLLDYSVYREAVAGV
ncbi:MAG: ABC transporter substrate-binding protein [Betaproteobacteria bacterium]|nr:ABC transporter substrate-binding protein [Betaproteobacteria bacterium]